MPKIGKKGTIVELIHSKTKINKDEIYDILRVLSDSLAEVIMEKNLGEKQVLHLGFINVYWQSALGKKPEIVIQPTERFKDRFAELKYERKTPLAQLLYDQLPPHLKDKMEKNRAKKQQKPNPDEF